MESKYTRSNKVAVVTGGAGYIGSVTTGHLLQQGYDVICIDNLANSDMTNVSRLERIAEDCKRNYKFVKRTLGLPTSDSFEYSEETERMSGYEFVCNYMRLLLSGYDEKVIIHFAALKYVGESSKMPFAYYNVNLQAMLEAISIANWYECNFVFSSSCTVYGNNANGKVHESTQFGHNESPYGASKQMCERILSDSAKQFSMPSISLRYFNPVGAEAFVISNSSSENEAIYIGENAKSQAENLLPWIQKSHYNGDILTVFGDNYETSDGTCVRDYVPVGDLARAHVSAAEYLANKRKDTEDGFNVAVNVGSGTGQTVLQFIEMYEEANDCKIFWEFGPRRHGDLEAVYADDTLAKTLLDFETDYESMVEALQNQHNYMESIKTVSI